jgi:hypothetical protein
MGEAHAMEEPEKLELALRTHIVENIVGRKVVDPDDEIAAEVAEFLGQLLVGGARQSVELSEGRGLEGAQLSQRKPVDWQNVTPCSALALTVATPAIAPAARVTATMVSIIRRRNRASA